MTTVSFPDLVVLDEPSVLNRVPKVTFDFWLIKLMAVTMGETAADYLNVNLGIGLTNTSLIMTAVLIGALVLQFRQKRYVPWSYWLAVVLISVVGTLVTDNLVDNFGVPMIVTAAGFSIALAATFALWYSAERTLSIHSIQTTRREAWYWLAILFPSPWALRRAIWSPKSSVWATSAPAFCSG